VSLQKDFDRQNKLQNQLFFVIIKLMKSKGNIILIVTFIVVGTVLFSAVGYLFYQNQKLSDKVSDSQVKTIATPTATTTIKATPNPQLSQNITPTPTSTSSKTKVPVVVFEAEGAMPSGDKLGIQARIIDPYIEYHTNEIGQPVVSITISPNTNVSKAEFPYLFNAVYESGGYSGLVIEKKNGQISWWFPECMNGCNLSQNFKTKYPEIAKIVD